MLLQKIFLFEIFGERLYFICMIEVTVCISMLKALRSPAGAKPIQLNLSQTYLTMGSFGLASPLQEGH